MGRLWWFQEDGKKMARKKTVIVSALFSFFCFCSSTSVQESLLPADLGQLVDAFKKFMKQQKETSEEISHFSDKAMRKVKQDTISQAQVCVV